MENYVREQMILVLAIMTKRQFVDGDANIITQMLNDLSQLIMSDNNRLQVSSYLNAFITIIRIIIIISLSQSAWNHCIVNRISRSWDVLSSLRCWMSSPRRRGPPMLACPGRLIWGRRSFSRAFICLESSSSVCMASLKRRVCSNPFQLRPSTSFASSYPSPNRFSRGISTSQWCCLESWCIYSKHRFVTSLGRFLFSLRSLFTEYPMKSEYLFPSHLIIEALFFSLLCGGRLFRFVPLCDLVVNGKLPCCKSKFLRCSSNYSTCSTPIRHWRIM